jgi:hypothetical protein
MMNTLENKILFAIALVMGLYMTHAGADSNEMVPPKKPTVIEQKLTTAKMWAIGFGADIKQQQIENLKTTKQALKTDWSWSEGGRFTYPIKNAWEDAKAQVRRDSKTVKGYWQTLADAVSSKMKAVEGQ